MTVLFLTLCLLSSSLFLKEVPGLQTLSLLARERKEVELSGQQLSLGSGHRCLQREGRALTSKKILKHTFVFNLGPTLCKHGSIKQPKIKVFPTMPMTSITKFCSEQLSTPKSGNCSDIPREGWLLKGPSDSPDVTLALKHNQQEEVHRVILTVSGRHV